ncbi:MAG: hypothetical protein KIT37_07950, partial [Steroidobacteraceae bacterium]|nr:hypothetical protein [Steroidobacteraceae bacterium]
MPAWTSPSTTEAGSVTAPAARTPVRGSGRGALLHAALKPAVFLACLLPFAVLVSDAFTDALGANPVETITHRTGEWGLRLLLVTLLVTPLRRLTGWNSLARVRRMLGLFAFFYVVLH